MTRTCLIAVPGLVCVAGLLLGGCEKNVRSDTANEQRHAASMKEVPDVNWTLELTGSGLGNPTVFTYEQLARMEMTRLADAVILRTHGPDEKGSWEGPALDDLLAAAQIKPGPMIFTLEAADRYNKQATREDLKSAIIALKDGEDRWLAERNPKRPLKLIPPHKAGDYWIRNLSRITVEPAPES